VDKLDEINALEEPEFFKSNILETDTANLSDMGLSLGDEDGKNVFDVDFMDHSEKGKRIHFHAVIGEENMDSFISFLNQVLEIAGPITLSTNWLLNFVIEGGVEKTDLVFTRKDYEISGIHFKESNREYGIDREGEDLLIKVKRTDEPDFQSSQFIEEEINQVKPVISDFLAEDT